MGKWSISTTFGTDEQEGIEDPRLELTFELVDIGAFEKGKNLFQSETTERPSVVCVVDLVVAEGTTQKILEDYLGPPSSGSSIDIIDDERSPTGKIARLIIDVNSDDNNRSLINFFKFWSTGAVKVQIGSNSSQPPTFEDQRNPHMNVLPPTIEDLAFHLSFTGEVDNLKLLDLFSKSMSFREKLVLTPLFLLEKIDLNIAWVDLSTVLTSWDAPSFRNLHFSYWYLQKLFPLMFQQIVPETNVDIPFMDLLDGGIHIKGMSKAFCLKEKGLATGIIDATKHVATIGKESVGKAYDALKASDLKTDPVFQLYMDQIVEKKKQAFFVLIEDADGDRVQITVPRKEIGLLKKAVAEELEVGADEIVKFERENCVFVKKQKHLDSTESGEFLKVHLGKNSEIGSGWEE